MAGTRKGQEPEAEAMEMWLALCLAHWFAASFPRESRLTLIGLVLLPVG